MVATWKARRAAPGLFVLGAGVDVAALQSQIAGGRHPAGALRPTTPTGVGAGSALASAAVPALRGVHGRAGLRQDREGTDRRGIGLCGRHDTEMAAGAAAGSQAGYIGPRWATARSPTTWIPAARRYRSRTGSLTPRSPTASRSCWSAARSRRSRGRRRRVGHLLAVSIRPTVISAPVPARSVIVPSSQVRPAAEARPAVGGGHHPGAGAGGAAGPADGSSSAPRAPATCARGGPGACRARSGGARARPRGSAPALTPGRPAPVPTPHSDSPSRLRCSSPVVIPGASAEPLVVRPPKPSPSPSIVGAVAPSWLVRRRRRRRRRRLSSVLPCPSSPPSSVSSVGAVPVRRIRRRRGRPRRPAALSSGHRVRWRVRPGRVQLERPGKSGGSSGSGGSEWFGWPRAVGGSQESHADRGAGIGG